MQLADHEAEREHDLIAACDDCAPVVVACAYVTTDAHAPAARTSEAYAWLILSIGAEQAAGTALAERLSEQPLVGAALPASGAAFILTLLLTAGRRLTPPNTPPFSHHHR
ncbi:hypothetical protein [Streptomyces sp. NPDC056785]|uniref:hypothetical protein n=1 Tax=Streptomyces sp. NPDC056785 TaxID=3345944 RepID=UPI0036A4F3F7